MRQVPSLPRETDEPLGTSCLLSAEKMREVAWLGALLAAHSGAPPRSNTKDPMPFHLSIVRGPHAGVDRADLKVRLEAMMRKRNLEVEEVSFLLTDDKQIHELNREYRGYDKPTDVLAFALTEGDVGPRDTGLLGDVIVSVPTARRQAREAKRPLVDELTMLLAHGLLHLLGYDHATVKEDRVMRAETDVLVAAADLASASKKKKARAPTKKRTATPAIAQRSAPGASKKAPKRR